MAAGVIEGCPNLETIKAQFCEEVMQSVSSWSSLTNIHLQCLGCRNDPTFKNLDKLIEAWDCSHVKQFELSCLSQGMFVSSVYLAVAKNCPLLTSLHIQYEDDVDAIMHAVSENCPSLRSLYCLQCDITDGGLIAVASCCKFLECLSVPHCESISDHSVRCILQNCKRLMELQVGGSVTDQAIAGVFDALPLLTLLDLRSALQVSLRGTHIFVNNVQSMEVENKYTIKMRKQLRISPEITISPSGLKIGLIVLLKQSPNLLHLKLVSYQLDKLLQEGVLSVLVQTCRELRSLVIHQRVSETKKTKRCNEALDLLAGAFTALEQLELASVPVLDNHIKKFVSMNLRLRKLGLLGCQFIGDAALSSIAGLSDLQSLKLTRNSPVPCESVAYVLQKCTKLH